MAKQTQKPAKLTRPAAAAQAVRDVTGPTTLTELVETAYGLFTDAGGKCEKAVMLSECKAAIRSAEMFGLVTVKRNEITIVPVQA
jgi:hypothetical protein